MSVILEFTIAASEFRLGEVLSGHGGMQFELERVVPTGRLVMPFVWVTGGDWDAFAERVRSHPMVEELLTLDTVDQRRLYRIEWTESPTGLVDAIARAEASILEARGGGEWTFRVRFTDHESLSQFHDDVSEQGLELRVDRTYELGEGADGDGHFGLTDDQREALVLALDRGYFATPRETNLTEMAAELDITRQALSNRVRRANEKVLSTVLCPAMDADTGEK